MPIVDHCILREFSYTTEDYATLEALYASVFDETVSADALKRADERIRENGCTLYRFFADHKGDIVGFCEARETPSAQTQNRFTLLFGVQAKLRGKGIGDSMYKQLIDCLSAHEPDEVLAVTYENQRDSVNFLVKRGFRLLIQAYKQHLSLKKCDLEKHTKDLKNLPDGVEIRTFASLSDDPQRGQKLYDLATKLGRDIPNSDHHTAQDFEAWSAENSVQNPDFLPDGFFVAVKDDEYIGMSQLWRTPDTACFHTGLTGVLRAHRRQGIAAALKIKTLEYAKACNAEMVTTFNERSNKAMLALNKQFGFKKDPAELTFRRVLNES